MSITGAMYTGISGLSANGEAINVIGNNIANVNTTGFKQGRMLFSDVLSSSINNGQIGRGVQIQAVQNVFSQGSFESTENGTDLAIQGDPLFVLSNGAQRYYSRAGAFSFDVDNTLVNPDGLQVLGYGIDQNSNLSNGVLGPIDLSQFSSVAPSATTAATVIANLDAGATAIAGAIDPTNPASYNFSTTMTTYNSQGLAQSTSVYFQKTAANTWNVNTYTDGVQVGGNVAVSFDANGNLTTASPVAFGGLSVSITGMTQYASPFLVSTQNQDGYAAGNLARIGIDAQGYVNVSYSNGLQQRVAQVALAKFQSLQGLDKAGGSLFEETTESGQANLVVASTPGIGKIFSNSLEQSNVDLATQFVKMIQAQRAFSANSKTITTADEMTQEVLTLKR